MFVLAVLCGFIFQTEKISQEKGFEYFHEKALGQPLRTGVPYGLWLAFMEKYPDILGRNWDQLSAKFGLVQDPSKKDGLPVGFIFETEPLSRTRFLMTNCSLCHTAKINGQIISGVGAQSLRPNAINNALMEIAGRDDFKSDELIKLSKSLAKKEKIPWGWRSQVVNYLAVHELKKRAKNYVSLDAGPGRNTPIEFAKQATKVSVEPPYGFVRFPPVWTYTKRKTFGWDGSMTGDHALAAASVEFNKGMTSSFIVSHRERWDSIYEYLKTIAPPKYPEPIEDNLAAQGMILYKKNCMSCHGLNNQYKERVIPLDEIGTDPDRLKSMNQELADARNKTSFGKLVPLKVSNGYVPPPLDGIWSRAPYLHNGSVPSLEDLLKPEKERPTRFYVSSDTNYDFSRVGVACKEEALADGSKGCKQISDKQYLFDTRKPGNNNQGHEYGTTLSKEERMALIEYLKQV